MSVLSELRERIKGGDSIIDPALYLSARMRDAENDTKDAQKRLVATERAASQLLGRYDSDGSLHREFRELIEYELRHMQ